MRQRPKVADWLKMPEQDWKESAADNQFAVPYLLAALRSRAPGMWSANLLELSRHLTSSVFLAVNTLSNQASAAEATCMERTPDPDDGDLPLPASDPLCRLIADPNDDDSMGDILFQLTQQLSLTGIALLWMPQTSEVEIPSELYVIPSASALPYPASPVHPNGSYLVQPYYPYGPFNAIPSWMNSAGARIPGEQILRIRNPHPILRYDGYAVLTALSRQIDTIESIDTARWNTQQKGTDPTMSFEFDASILDPAQQDMQRLRDQLEALYSGPLGKKLFLVPPGLKASPVSNKPSEMGWESGWAQLTDFVLAAYGVPKSVAGLQDDVSYATLYSSLKQFYLFSLNPLLTKIATRLTKRLIRPFFGDDLYLKLEGAKIADEEMLERQLATDSTLGVRTKNEWRKMRGLKPLKGKEGDELVYSGPKPQPEQGEQPMSGGQDADMAFLQGTRPENPAGQGSLPPRKRYNPERMAGLLEHYKTRGTIIPSTNGHS